MKWKGNVYMIPQANQIYRHFKGNLYRVIAVAMHTETEEELVVYQALYGDFKVYARPLSMFMSEVDKEKYPDVTQKMRFEPVEQMVEAVMVSVSPQFKVPEERLNEQSSATIEETADERAESDMTEEVTSVQSNDETEEENLGLDPLLEEYLDTDSYREKLNILHGLQHRITEHMLNTMAIVIDFELPEGDIQTKYDALNDCLLTKEKYECNRIL